jgi:hypothetical protein
MVNMISTCSFLNRFRSFEWWSTLTHTWKCSSKWNFITIYISCIMYHMPIDYTIFISSVRRVMPCERRMKNAKPSLHISWSTAGLGSQNTPYLVVYSWSKEVKSLSVYTELDVYIYNNWM